MTRPTHQLADGTLVFADGYDAADITPLAAEYWDDMDLAGAKAAKWAAVKLVHERKLTEGVMTAKGMVDCDEVSQGRVVNAIMLMEKSALTVSPVTSIDWTMFDNSVSSHTLAELEAMGLAVGARAQSLFTARRAHRTAIFSASTISAVELIDEESGW